MMTASFLLAGCGGGGAVDPTITPAPSPTPDPLQGREVEIGDFTGLLWGEGDYGVILVGASSGAASAWQAPALAIASQEMTVLALNDYSYSYVVEAIHYLQDASGVGDVALIGASTGAPPVIGAGIIAPDLVDQMILISGFGEYDRMGEFPKLFIVAEGEAGMVRRARTMAEESPGTENELLVLPGSSDGQAMFDSDSGDELLAAIIDRLNQFR